LGTCQARPHVSALEPTSTRARPMCARSESSLVPGRRACAGEQDRGSRTASRASRRAGSWRHRTTVHSQRRTPINRYGWQQPPRPVYRWDSYGVTRSGQAPLHRGGRGKPCTWRLSM
jgi:hypothetical protein